MGRDQERDSTLRFPGAGVGSSHNHHTKPYTPRVHPTCDTLAHDGQLAGSVAPPSTFEAEKHPCGKLQTRKFGAYRTQNKAMASRENINQLLVTVRIMPTHPDSQSQLCATLVRVKLTFSTTGQTL
mmetsp:Transcript_50812/g.135591  ORF Transcript_50812/g.135591 Transcript_50812/m.135591 type:complete len:126 (+) Transcript_50812:120-497(+)